MQPAQGVKIFLQEAAYSCDLHAVDESFHISDCIPADGDYHDSRLLHSARPRRSMSQDSRKGWLECRMQNNKFEHCTVSKGTLPNYF